MSSSNLKSIAGHRVEDVEERLIREEAHLVIGLRQWRANDVTRRDLEPKSRGER